MVMVDKVGKSSGNNIKALTMVMICKIQKKTISRKVGKYPGYNNQAHTMVMIC